MKNPVLLLSLIVIMPIFFSCNHLSADLKKVQHFGDDTIALKKYAKNYFNKKLARKLGRGTDILREWRDSGLIIRAGDLNGDKLNDVALQYNFEGFDEGGGNINLDIMGKVIFINNGKRIVYKGNFTDLPLAEMINIKEGIINAYTLDYADTDARCCPSIYHPIQLKYTGKKLIEIK
jgi:hypothetical protein